MTKTTNLENLKKQPNRMTTKEQNTKHRLTTRQNRNHTSEESRQQQTLKTYRDRRTKQQRRHPLLNELNLPHCKTSLIPRSHRKVVPFLNLVGHPYTRAHCVHNHTTLSHTQLKGRLDSVQEAKIAKPLRLLKS